jgi:hypothetical protein
MNNDPIYGGERTIYAAVTVVAGIVGCVLLVGWLLLKG